MLFGEVCMQLRSSGTAGALGLMAILALTACATSSTDSPGTVGGPPTCVPTELPDVSTPTSTSGPPIYGPHTTRPKLNNPSDVERALLRFYTPTLRDRGIVGTVQVWLRIPETGTPDRVCLAQSSGSNELDTAGLNVARAMRFTAAELDQVPVTVWSRIPVSFRVRN